MGRPQVGMAAAVAWLIAMAGAAPALAQNERLTCSATVAAPMAALDPAACARLDDLVRRPGDFNLATYQGYLDRYFQNFCHRDQSRGWRHDKDVRATGPYTAALGAGGWSAAGLGTHAPVMIWYNDTMIDWLKANRPADPAAAPETVAPVPDGAIMVKEMYPWPAQACAGEDPLTLVPTSGAAIMIRDNGVSADGWFWGWYGWRGSWAPDWPPAPDNAIANMGFGQYCTNCHASARK